MKRLFIVLVLFVTIIFSSFSFVRESISLLTGEILERNSQNLPVDNTTVRDLEYLSDGARVTYKFGSVTVDRQKVGDKVGKWQLDGFAMHHTAGYPELPVKIDRFYVPMEYDVSLEVEDADYIDIKTEISAAPEPQYDSDNSCIKDAHMTHYKGFFPESIAIKAQEELFRGYKIITIEVSPLLYDMVDERLRCHSSVSYTIRYKAPATDMLKTQAFSRASISNYPIGELSTPLIQPSDANLPKNGVMSMINKYLFSLIAKYPLWLFKRP